MVPALLLVGPVHAQESAPGVVDEEARGGNFVLYGEPVKRVQASRIRTWKIVDDQRLIFYTSPSKPYLVTLRRKSPRLRFDPIIGLNLRSNSIDARFDAIYVEGFPYPIERIEKITREVADLLLGREPRGEKESPEEGDDQDLEEVVEGR